MKRLTIVALSLFVLCALIAAPAAAEEAKKEEAKKPAIPAGQKVFTEARCTMCHTVFSAGIGEMPKTEEEKEKALDRPPDLSMAGKGRTAGWLSLYLMKEETLNDKQHGMKFTGKEEDLGTLVEWLMTLKPAEEKVEKAEEKIEKAEGKVEKAAAKSAGCKPGCQHHAKADKDEKADKDAGCMNYDHGDKSDDKDDSGSEESEKGE
jgi:mono/diheme cytochrome c family protein